MAARVSVKQLDTYEPDQMLEAVRALLAPLGGIQHFVQPGQKVLLKPNILGGFDVDKAVTTHPSLVRAMTLLVQEAGGRVLIGDSPGIHNPKTAAKKCGIYAVVEETGAEWADFTHTTVIENQENQVVKRLTMAQAVADADVIISLPKLKTHVLMQYTGAVKNQFGLIVGSQKAKYHYRLKTREWLIRLFFDINRTAKPVLAVMDAVVGMQGNGPSGGEPRAIGVLLAGSDLTAVDVIACSLIGLDPLQVPSIKEAVVCNFGVTTLDNIETVGDDWRENKLSDFKQIKQMRNILLFPVPDFMQQWIRRQFAPKPRIDFSRCIECGACNRGCPVEPPAIDPQRKKKPVDDDRCIRCYCCHEFCPVKAIRLTRF